MKTPRFIIACFLVISMISCKKKEDPSKSEHCRYTEINTAYGKTAYTYNDNGLIDEKIFNDGSYYKNIYIANTITVNYHEKDGNVKDRYSFEKGEGSSYVKARASRNSTIQNDWHSQEWNLTYNGNEIVRSEHNMSYYDGRYEQRVTTYKWQDGNIIEETSWYKVTPNQKRVKYYTYGDGLQKGDIIVGDYYGTPNFDGVLTIKPKNLPIKMQTIDYDNNVEKTRWEPTTYHYEFDSKGFISSFSSGTFGANYKVTCN